MRASVATYGVPLTLVLGLLAGANAARAWGEGPAPYGPIPVPADDPEAWASLGESSSWRAAPFQDGPLFPPGFQTPVLRHLILPAHLGRGDPDDPGRHIGLGQPLEGTSWRNRPYQAGWLWGSISGDSLIRNRIDQSSGMFGGYRIGWDFDHYWGTEARFAFNHMDLVDRANLPPRTGENILGDVHLLYYPWGDARWRPFLAAGIGFARFRFDDENGRPIETVFGFPLGGGVKYLYRRWLAVRLSVMDNLAIGAYDLGTQHNVSVTAGVEVRFGGTRRSYFPYNPSRHLW